MLLLTGLLLAVALSAPVEALHRRRVPRPAAGAYGDSDVTLEVDVQGGVGEINLEVV
jgi:hypothetical protein